MKKAQPVSDASRSNPSDRTQSQQSDRSQHHQSALSRYRPYLYVIVPLLLVVVVFSGTLGDSLTNWDDDVYVTDNTLIRSLSPQNIVKIFSPTTFVCGNYHPLTIFSLAINYALGGLHPAGYVATNILLHLLNVLLVFVFIRKISRSNLIASLCAVLFGIHPMHVESVAWVTGRKDLLFALFYLVALLRYIRYLRQGGRERAVSYAIISVSFLLSLLSKSAAVTLPLALLLLDYYYRRKFSARLLLEKLPFVGLAAVLGIIAINGQRHSDALDFKYVLPLVNNIALGCYSYMFYIVKLFLPFGLSADYPYPIFLKAKLPLSYMLSPLFALITAGAVYFGRRSRVVLFGFGFFLINVVFILHFVPVGATITADRFSYLSYIGLFYIIACGIDKIVARGFAKNVPVCLAGACIIAILAFTAHRRCAVWKDSISLWTDVVSYNPNFTGFYGFGVALMNSGRSEEATANFQKALAINPTDWKVQTALGDGLTKSGKIDEAIMHYRKALGQNLNYTTALNGLGCALLKAGRIDEAMAQFQKAIEIKSDDFLAHYNMGAALLQTGQTEASIGFLRKALEIKPANDSALNDLGNALLRTGHTEEAIAHLEKALSLNGNNWGTLGNLAQAYMQVGRPQDAATCFRRASALNPTNIAILHDLCTACLQAGQIDDAIDAAEKARALAEATGQGGLAQGIGQDIDHLRSLRNGSDGRAPVSRAAAVR